MDPLAWNSPLIILLALAVALLAVLGAFVVIPTWPAIKDVLTGVDVDPRLVGLARGILLYFLPLGAGAAVVWVNGWTSPALIPIAASVVALLRLLESMADQKLKPAQNAPDPPPVAGGGGPGLAPAPATRRAARKPPAPPA
jgi:hypothetical protein